VTPLRPRMVAPDDRLPPGLGDLFELFWHPVCTVDELASVSPHPLAVQLLGRSLAIARTGTGLVALADRCIHRSARLSVGWVDGDTVRCGYHGWAYGGDGRCREIPSMPDGPIPERACVPSFDVEERHGLVWVRLDGSAGTSIPRHPAYERHSADPGSMRVLVGDPYTWPVGAPRRVENFVDLAHFAWVHDGSLGRRDEPVPQLPVITRADGELRFAYDPPDMPVEVTALFGHSEYRMPIPLTVSIEFWLANGAYRHLWMTASPIDMGTCRAFWTVSRDDDLDGDDAAHMAFQAQVLAEDEPVVCNQVPRELVLEPGFELSVRTDRVSIEYRRWLSELVHALALGPERVRAVLNGS
jgi:phenylpropionate dioxygenase-like ring-hydroxylating dioxygenase large terminal subunit